jgi:hypothetical protein
MVDRSSSRSSVARRPRRQAVIRVGRSHSSLTLMLIFLPAFRATNFLRREVSPDKRAPWQKVILYEGNNRLLQISQSPKPSDPFCPDIPADFYQSSEQIQTEHSSRSSPDASTRSQMIFRISPASRLGTTSVASLCHSRRSRNSLARLSLPPSRNIPRALS